MNNMEGKEIETANPFCYGCHMQIDGNISMMATQRFMIPFHDDCFCGYIEEFRRIAPIIDGEVRGEGDAAAEAKRIN